MSHHHFCDYTGHVWACSGMARRPFAGQSHTSICVCPVHQVPMEEGDHTECPVELLACEEHCDLQLRELNLLETGTQADSGSAAESTLFVHERGRATLGLCIWCGRDFYTMDEVTEHNADNMSACPVFKEFNRNEAESVIFEK